MLFCTGTRALLEQRKGCSSSGTVINAARMLLVRQHPQFRSELVNISHVSHPHERREWVTRRAPGPSSIVGSGDHQNHFPRDAGPPVAITAKN